MTLIWRTIGSVLLVILVGCASVPMASGDRDAEAKAFKAKSDKASIYVYRNENIAAAIKMPVVLDGKLVGDTGPRTFLLLEVPPGRHMIVSKTGNDSAVDLDVAGGRVYFLWQEVKFGAFAARSHLQQVDEARGKAGVKECKLIEVAQ